MSLHQWGFCQDDEGKGSLSQDRVNRLDRLPAWKPGKSKGQRKPL